MKLKILKDVGGYKKGDVVDLPQPVAVELLAEKSAKKAD